MAGPATLSKKLGVRGGHQVVLLGGPERICVKVEGELASVGDVKVSRQLRPAPVDTVMVFCDKLEDLEARIGAVTERLHPDGQVWVAWRSNRAQDVREDMVRRVGLAAGMVDTKACALDRVWFGMRLVIRPENRDALAYRIDRAPVTAPRRARRITRSPDGSRSVASGAGSGLQTARARKRS